MECLWFQNAQFKFLSAMQQQARLREFLVQNSLSAATQVFQECWSGLPSPYPPKMKIWTDLGTCCVDRFLTLVCVLTYQLNSLKPTIIFEKHET